VAEIVIDHLDRVQMLYWYSITYFALISLFKSLKTLAAAAAAAVVVGTIITIIVHTLHLYCFLNYLKC
jgi:hypothetical protein